MPLDAESTIAVVGDVHGHLQLACAMLARWQDELGVRFEAVFLCGDVGTFTDPSQLDSATRAHAKTNPCELEFLYQWSTSPPAPWLDYIFQPQDVGGLGLGCPVVMVHGNHEGFDHLETLVFPAIPALPVEIHTLPSVDPHGHIRLLPPGWRAELPSGLVVGGLGGIQPGQRAANYHRMAYLDESAVGHLLDTDPFDVLVTHQGPSGVQGTKGSELLDLLLDAGMARVWFHGHSIAVPEPLRAGPGGRCLVVPLGDIAFHCPRDTSRQDFAYEVGKCGWAWATIGPRQVSVMKETPPFFREFRRTHWTARDGLLVCPPLASVTWGVADG
jgi:hypothetical protein